MIEIQDLDEYFEYILRYAIRTKRGFLPNNPNKINQDNYILCPNIGTHQYLLPCYLGKKSYSHFFSVCDGHGLNGHFVSSFLKQQFPIFLNTKKEQLEQHPLNTLKMIFHSISQKMINESQIDLAFSGSTVVSLYLLHNKLFCANLGDSRAILGRKNDSVWSAISLSRDHKPSEPDEAERVHKAGGRIEAFKDQLGHPIGPLRVWVQGENVPGLAMTRSMGDMVASSVGVSQEPELTEFTITSEDRIIVVGSDGVWEFISNDEILQMLIPFYEKSDLEGACEILLSAAHNKWVQNCTVIDDITFIIIFMNY